VIEAIVRFLLGERILGLRGLPLEEEDAPDHAFPVFEDRVWQIDNDGEHFSQLEPSFLEALDDNAAPGVFLLGLAPHIAGRRQPRDRLGRGSHRQSAALIFDTLASLPKGTKVAVLAFEDVVRNNSSRELREFLDETTAVSWIITFGNRRQALPRISPMMRFSLVVCEIGTGPAAVRRLVNLDDADGGDWLAALQQAARRGGREYEDTIVLREQALGGEPWIFERWSRSYDTARADASEIGALCPLGSMTTSIDAGIPLARHGAHIVPVEDPEEEPSGFMPLIGGREIRHDGLLLPGRYWVPSDTVPSRALANAGDTLLRAFRGPNHHGGLVTSTVPDGVVVAFDNSVLCLRWNGGLRPQARRLVLAWLASEQAALALHASGAGGLRLSVTQLRDLEVPNPSDSVVSAMESLAELEDWYRRRANDVAESARRVLEADRYGDAIPTLIRAQEAERTMVNAAMESTRFHYRVRNGFPHPIALRWDKLQQADDGNDRTKEILDCAEHLVHLLAVCAIVQLSATRGSPSLPSPLKAAVRKRSLRFSWGLSWAVVMDAARATRRASAPLATPFPQLALLEDDDELKEAERTLRTARNNDAHLARLSEPDQVKQSRKLSDCLDLLLESLSFLTDVQLVRVLDYSLHPVSAQRTASVEYLHGSSSVFRRANIEVAHEVARGTTGILRGGNSIVSLGPWLVEQVCQHCGRPEMFLFSRVERGVATYVAMETGHPWEDASLGTVIVGLIASD